MRLRYSLLLAFLPAVLPACGGSGSTDAGGNPQIVTVSMTDNNGLEPYAFSSATLTVARGTIVKWTNSGKAKHSSTSDEAQPIWDSGDVQPAGGGTCDPYDPYCTPGTSPAGTYQRTFNTVGTYPYHCQNHGALGMTGTITVTP